MQYQRSLLRERTSWGFSRVIYKNPETISRESFLPRKRFWKIPGGKSAGGGDRDEPSDAGRRWDLLKVMTGAGPVAIREVARRMERAVKAVHADVHSLLIAGFLRKTDDGKIVFPFDEIHVDFTVRAA